MSVTTQGPTRRRGSDTRSAILATAAQAFREQGYDVATLEDIAEQVGITRPAVLHHFASKEDLLRQIVTPFMAGLDRILDEFEGHLPLSNPQRRSLLTTMVEHCARHRPAASLITRDITAHAHLGPELQLQDRARRFVGIVDSAPGPTSPAKAFAVLGVLVRPLAAPDDVVDFNDPQVRQLLIDAAMAVLCTPVRPAA